MKAKIGKYIAILISLCIAALFVIKFAGPSFLRLYIETGIGTCAKIPLLCMVPDEEIINPKLAEDYQAGLILYKYPARAAFPAWEIYLPNGFNVTRELTSKIYYKKTRLKGNRPTIYLLNLSPDFFVRLFPELQKRGIKDDYEFIRRTMIAKLKDIQNINDAFFVIMKGIFIPDLGEQKEVKMVQFTVNGKRGFINYSLNKNANYFDCNIFNEKGDFFKIYIKDKDRRLDLTKVLTLISLIK